MEHCRQLSTNPEQCAEQGCISCMSTLLWKFDNNYPYLDDSEDQFCAMTNCNTQVWKGGFCQIHGSALLGDMLFQVDAQNNITLDQSNKLVNNNTNSNINNTSNSAWKFSTTSNLPIESSTYGKPGLDQQKLNPTMNPIPATANSTTLYQTNPLDAYYDGKQTNLQTRNGNVPFDCENSVTNFSNGLLVDRGGPLSIRGNSSTPFYPAYGTTQAASNIQCAPTEDGSVVVTSDCTPSVSFTTDGYNSSQPLHPPSQISSSSYILPQSTASSSKIPSSNTAISPVAKNLDQELCHLANCRNVARMDGLCVTHINERSKGMLVDKPCKEELPGIKRKNGARVCCITGCRTLAKSGGLCVRHGGGKRCSIEGCDSLVLRDNLCSRHGQRKQCTYEGCIKNAIAWGLCSNHGGAKYCNKEGCKTLQKAGGYCVRHGGGARCIVPGCSKLILRVGYCRDHLCRVKGCEKKSIRDRYCEIHHEKAFRHPNSNFSPQSSTPSSIISNSDVSTTSLPTSTYSTIHTSNPMQEVTAFD